MGGNDVENLGLSDLNTLFVVGKESSTLFRRAVYQWNIPDNSIPDNSTISSITLYFTYTKNGHSYELPASFYSISIDIVNPSQAQFNQMWDEMTYPSPTIGTQTGANGVMNFVSNISTNPFNTAVRNALLNNRFVLGIKWDEKPYVDSRTWNISNSSLILRIEYAPPSQQVTIDQRNSSNSQVGTLKKWEGTAFGEPFSPGTPFTFLINSEQTIQGDQNVYSGEKYNNWNGDNSDVTNHHSFVITPQVELLTSKFEPTNPEVIVKNSLENSLLNGGTISFKDPWFIDYADPSFGNTLRNRGMESTGNDALIFRSRTSPFYPNSTYTYENGEKYNGVFLSKYPASTPSYYSVSVQATQTINLGGNLGSRNFYFINWTATSSSDAEFQDANSTQTAVVFKNNNVTVQANLKGDLLSSSTTGFSSNSQNKIVRSDNGYLHLVYESMGSAWYTMSTNNGNNWSPELRVNPFGTTAKYPSIAQSADGLNYIYITYQIDQDVFPNVDEGIILTQYNGTTAPKIGKELFMNSLHLLMM